MLSKIKKLLLPNQVKVKKKETAKKKKNII